APLSTWLALAGARPWRRGVSSPTWNPHGHPHLPDPTAPSTHARCAATPRAGRRAGADQRSTPVGVPARALAGARVAVGLYRVDGHAGRHARARRAVRRQPLLGP